MWVSRIIITGRLDSNLRHDPGEPVIFARRVVVPSVERVQPLLGTPRVPQLALACSELGYMMWHVVLLTGVPNKHRGLRISHGMSDRRTKEPEKDLESTNHILGRYHILPFRDDS